MGLFCTVEIYHRGLPIATAIEVWCGSGVDEKRLQESLEPFKGAYRRGELDRYIGRPGLYTFRLELSAPVNGGPYRIEETRFMGSRLLDYIPDLKGCTLKVWVEFEVISPEGDVVPVGGVPIPVGEFDSYADMAAWLANNAAPDLDDLVFLPVSIQEIVDRFE